jgi:hypothetical protein
MMTDIEVPRVKVEVTQEDIDKGVPEDCEYCAVALALKRKYKTDDVKVSIPDDYVLLTVNGKELNIRSNHENDILDFIDVFDKQYNYTTTEEYYDRQKPKPFEFEVNVI